MPKKLSKTSRYFPLEVDGEMHLSLVIVFAASAHPLTHSSRRERGGLGSVVFLSGLK